MRTPSRVIPAAAASRRPRAIAFLRAVNVGGRNVTMAELRRIFESLGCEEVETFIASGNVIFAAPATGLVRLHRAIEDGLRASLGYEVTVFIRTEAEVAAVAQYEPFDGAQRAAARSLNVGFLTAPLTARASASLKAMTTAIDDFHVHGREVYWLCKVGQADSTFSNVRFEKMLEARVTFRGVNTIARLAAKLRDARGRKPDDAAGDVKAGSNRIVEAPATRRRFREGR
jgi:uncharacterized protein (DUF1697 family)